MFVSNAFSQVEIMPQPAATGGLSNKLDRTGFIAFEPHFPLLESFSLPIRRVWPPSLKWHGKFDITLSAILLAD